MRRKLAAFIHKAHAHWLRAISRLIRRNSTVINATKIGQKNTLLLPTRLSKTTPHFSGESKMLAPDGAYNGAVLQATHLFALLFFARATDRVIVG